MWIDKVKDSPIVKEIVDIAGKERIDERVRRALVNHALKNKVPLPHSDEETLDVLASKATEGALYEMVEGMPNMADFNDFARSHGVEL